MITGIVMYPRDATPATPVRVMNGSRQTAAKPPRSTVTDPIPAIGYVRVSQAREEMISPATQKAAITEWAQRRGRVITDWVEDLDLTGREFARRKIAAMTERIKAGEAREIAVWKYSRFGRNRLGVAVNLDALEKAGGQLQSATEEVDAQTATGRFTRGMLFEVAAFESDRIAETWKEAYDHRVRDQLPPLGRPRFGYVRLGRVRDEDDPHRTRRDKGDAQPERYVPDPFTGPALAGMYRDYSRGEGGPRIARRLNEQGIANACGNPWYGRTVVDVLDSGFGAGFLRVHDPRCDCGTPGRCKRKVLIRGRHEPVITEAEWQAYLARREVTRTEPPRRMAPVYAVSGMVRCGHCGSPVVVASARRRDGDVTFACSKRKLHGSCPGNPSVPLSVLTEVVREWLETIAGAVDAQEVTREKTARRTRADEDRVRRQLAQADRALADLAVRRAETPAEVMPDSAWEAAARKLTARRTLLDKQLAAVAREAAAVSASPVPAVRGLMQAWAQADGPEMNLMLRAVVRKIKVWRDGVAERDEKGHFRPPPVRVAVVPRWVPEEEEPR